MMEGSESVKIMTDPDPGDPKTYIRVSNFNPYPMIQKSVYNFGPLFRRRGNKVTLT